MPKPDQNVSSSAALQRPQRQKALPKPVAKEQPPREDQTSDGSGETSLLDASLIDVNDESSQNSPLISQSQPETTTSPEPKPKKVITYQPGTVVAKAKPKLKPKDLAIAENLTEKAETIPELAVDREVKDQPEISEPMVDEVVNEVAAPEPPAQDGEDVIEDLSILEVAIAPVNNPSDSPDNNPTDNSADSSISDSESSSENNEEDDGKKTKLIAESSDHAPGSFIESSDKNSDPLAEIELSEESSHESMGRSLEETNDEANDELNLEAQESQPLESKSSESQSPEPSAPSNPMFLCQAVGIVKGKYIPGVQAFHKGEIETEAGFTYKAFVLSKAIKSLEKKTDLSISHDFVVYPKTSRFHGVRFEVLATDLGSKVQEFSDRHFNVRGLVTKHREDSVLIEIHRRPEYVHPAQNDRFTLEIKGEMPVEMLQQFVFVKCELVETYLRLISYEHLACAIMAPSKKTEKPTLKPKPLQTATSDPDQSLLDQN